MVEHVPERIIAALPAGRSGIIGFAAAQFDAGYDEMQLDTIFMGVPHPENAITVAFQAGKGSPFELSHGLFLLGGRWGVFRRKAEDAARVSVFICDRIYEPPDDGRIAAEYFRLRSVLRFFVFAHAAHIVHRPGASSTATWEKFDHHNLSLLSTASSSCTRSRTSSTRELSNPCLWMLAQRVS